MGGRKTNSELELRKVLPINDTELILAFSEVMSLEKESPAK